LVLGVIVLRQTEKGRGGSPEPPAAIEVNRPNSVVARVSPAKSQPKVDRPSYFQMPVTLAKKKNENEVAGAMATILAEGADIRRRSRFHLPTR